MTAWPDQVFQKLQRAQIGQVAYVPDAGHAHLIQLCHDDPHIRAIPLTTEEEGVAIVAGAWLGNARGALLLQSSGVGNCINMLAMIRECRFPLLMLVTMRGEWGEFNPWQVPMGQSTDALLQLAGVIVHRVDDPAQLAPTVDAAAELAFNANQPVAVVISQRIVGVKDWQK